MARQIDREMENLIPMSEPIEIEEPADVSLQNVLADIGSGDAEAKVNVYRAMASKGMKGGAFLFSCHPAEFSLEKLRDMYGGGDYRVHVRSNGRMVANQLVSIEESKVPPVPQGHSVYSVGMEKIAEMLSSGLNSLGQLIVQSRPAEQRSSEEIRRAMLQDMLLMKQLFDQPRQDNNQIDLFMKGIELAKEIVPRSGETGGADILMEALKTFGRPIADAALSAQAAAPAKFQPTDTPVLAAPAGQPQTHSSDNGEVMLKKYLHMLLNLAKEDRDPYVYAPLIVDQVPQVVLDKFLNAPDLTNEIASIVPEATAYRQWITTLGEAIREELTAANEPDRFGFDDTRPTEQTHPDPGRKTGNG